VRRLRIALVSEHASPLATLGGVDAGGQNVAVAALATELGRRGHQVVVHTRRDDPKLPRRVPLAHRVVVDHVPAGPPEPIPKDELFPYMGAFATDLRRQWEINRPDVVHSHFWMSGWAALVAGRPLRLPVLHTFHALGVVKRRHQGEKDTSPPERLAVEEQLVRCVDCVLATCSDELFELVRLGAVSDRISVVPCGVDPGVFGPTGPTEPRGAGVHRLVVVSRLVERKGVGTTISALADIPDAELLIAGGGDAATLADDPEARRLLDLAEQADVADRVRFLGRLTRRRVASLLRSAVAVVCVPWFEPFGLVALEAMACGVPVVASAVGGFTDTVVDGTTGVLVPPRNPGAVAEAVRSLLADERRRAALGAAGLVRVRARYTWPRVVDSMLEAYVRSLDARASQSPEPVDLTHA
jgi:glycosyltransferase involved in cell wall biosynthesis